MSKIGDFFKKHKNDKNTDTNEKEGYGGEVNLSSNKQTSKAKQILPKLLVGIIVLGTLFFAVNTLISQEKKVKKPEQSKIVETVEEDEEEVYDDLLVLPSKNILAYSDSGVVSLYDENEKLLDKINIFDGESIKNIDEETFEDISDEKSVKDELLLETAKLTMALSDNKNEEEIDKIKNKIDSLYEKLDDKDMEDIKEEVSNVADDSIDTEKQNDNYINLLYRDGSNLVFKSNTNKLFLVTTKEEKLNSVIIASGDMVNNLVKGCLTERGFYAVNTNNEIVYLSGTSDTKNKIDIKEKANNLMVVDDSLIYSDDNSVYLYDLITKEVNDKISFGAKTEHFFTDGKHLYIINDFGQGKDNSILAKVLISQAKTMDQVTKDDVKSENGEAKISKTLYVEEIMELKGKRSKFVDINDNKLFIEQMDSLKMIDMKDFKADGSYKKKEFQSNGLINNSSLYETKDGKITKLDLETLESKNTEIMLNSNIILVDKTINKANKDKVENTNNDTN